MGTAVQQVAESFDTLALHAGAVADPTTGALLVPIYQTTTYRQEAVGKDKGFTYRRSANPTVSALERRLAALEGAESNDKMRRFLQSRPEVSRVFYPGLRGHPGREIHRRQADGNGAVVSFTTGDDKLSSEIVDSTKLFKVAVSFGSVGSTISLPCRMSHASIPSALRDRLAPPSDLVHLSVGIEDPGDLLEDLERAFELSSRQNQLEEAYG